jgi:hypothetical protein
VAVRSLSAWELLMYSESMLVVVAASFRILALGRVGSETLETIKDPSLGKKKQFTIIILLWDFNNKKSTDLATAVSIPKESVNWRKYDFKFR